MIKRLVMMAVLMLLILAAGCSQNSEEMSEPNEDIREITMCESWGFEAGFSTIVTPEKHPNPQAAFYLVNFYETLVNYQGGKLSPGWPSRGAFQTTAWSILLPLEKASSFPTEQTLTRLSSKRT